MLKFIPLSLDIRDKYENFYQRCSEKSSDTSFVNLWAWNNKYQTEVAFDDNLCWLRFLEKEKYVYGPPLGQWNEVDWKEKFAQNLPSEVEFKCIPENLLSRLQNIFEKKLDIKEDRDNWEYIYIISDLISLSGEKYRNQRKLSNQFFQNNDYKLLPISEKNIEDVKSFQLAWLQQSTGNSIELNQENEAVYKVLNSWRFLSDKVFGYILYANNNIVGYTIGEKQDEEHIIIHFEKALYEVRGAYPAINKLTLQTMPQYKYVNREQDLGIEGLRRAKEEYNPIGFVKKYRLLLRQN